MKKAVGYLILVAAVLALGVLAVVQSRQLGLQESRHAEEVAALRQQVERLGQRVKVEQRRAKEPAAEQPLERAAEAAPAAAPAEAARPAAAALPGTNFMGAVADMMKNPQMKEMIRAQQKVVVGQMYGGLARYLTLSPEMKERLDQLLLERQMALAEQGVAMMSGSEEERRQAAEAAKALKEEYDQSIRDLLGSQDYEVLQQYEQSLAEQTSVSMFKGTLSGDDALSEQQEADLVAALYQARQELPKDSLFNRQPQEAQDPSQLTQERVAEALKQMEVLQQRYAEQASSVLTPAQLERFRQWQQQMAAMQRAGLNMAAQMFGQDRAGAPAK